LGRTAKLHLSNGFKYQGKITKVAEGSVILNDRYKGEMIIALERITHIEGGEE